MNNPIYPGITLNNHYRIVRELGHGGFGRTYLAEDAHRFNEPCVLKEFAPQVHGSYALQKSEELFEREAGVLYKLQHNQIPRFRELFRVSISDRGYLFLVQDYVPGQTYRFLLDARKRQGLRFIEAEINQLLIQILPVLEYIHSLGVLHRDISPDNLILRLSDGMPVLIDFGGVKQVAATVESLFAEANGTPAPATRIGKLGYAPVEQMQMGIVYPHSDLYALAATVLVLLTGKEPHQLLDSQTLHWNWRAECSLSPNLSLVLDKMLAQQPSQRYSSAREVMLALSGNPPLQPPLPPAPDFGARSRRITRLYPCRPRAKTAGNSGASCCYWQSAKDACLENGFVCGGGALKYGGNWLVGGQFFVKSAIKSAERFPASKPEAAARRCFASSLCKAQN